MKRLTAAWLLCLGTVLHAGGIVSLLPGITDMVVDLGASGRLVGCTRYAVLPPDHPATRLGGLYDLNVEALLRLQPDMVLAPREMGPALEPVTDAGIPVHLFRFDTLADIVAAYTGVGRLLHREALARSRVANLKRQLASPPLPGAPVRVLVITGGEGLTGGAIYAAGRSLFGELVTALGAENAVRSDLPYPSLGREGVLALDPDLVLLLSVDRVDPLVPADSPLAALKAVRLRHMVNIHGPRVLQPGPILFRLVPVIRDILKQYAENRSAPLPSHLAVD